ncbi:PREDICTED: platelet-derived growth factor D isoform X1 [Poecilia mexicana]|uniref:platelet-derived growth factor D isoform X1 n=1 Tax=Poecilia mexicana TaxID=48701 RepID=UPI00072E8F13|nr:PREDICTED: platelet-derived growth factor D isoform X1 [Poecilia mexicana]XP_016532880.1 PREDICTED: platelet-derived growth factor D isoform X2 [Poecilia formosa]
MNGAMVFQMWIILLLATLSKVGKAQVANAKVLRGNSRRDDSNRPATDLYHKDENITVTPVGGVIFSPNYPKAYPRNLRLSWKLLAPPGNLIHLQFDEQFHLEEPANGKCSYDFVEVEEKSQTNTIKWGRWCGQKAPSSLTSKSSMLRIIFNSDDYFVAKPGFKIYYSLLGDANWEAVTELMSDMGANEMPATEVPQTLEDLDRTIATFDTIEQLLQSLSPDTWRQDLDNIYTQTYIYYRSKSYHLASRQNKVDLNRLHDDVKRYSCTPRNYSVNLREELKTTNAVFFPRCLLVKRCGGNCGCGTNNWNTGCTCQPSKTTTKLHEVLKYAPETTPYKHQQRQRVRWVIDEIFLSHHEMCECACPLQPPR